MTSPKELDVGNVQYISNDLVDELGWFLANYNWQNLGRLHYTLNSSQAFKSTSWSKRVDKQILPMELTLCIILTYS